MRAIQFIAVLLAIDAEQGRLTATIAKRQGYDTLGRCVDRGGQERSDLIAYLLTL